ncbi:hypothetical protein T01_3922 [Trichinella spiralis]|uniref:Uncharacterized protein n=1 Tax=Trichinella spiralis TaxID=6334 RepID=A0A0V1BU08_TRISP|nr:hypothetical protein T01_3922 [Trichinella spiralis]
MVIIMGNKFGVYDQNFTFIIKYGNKLILDCQQNLNFNNCKVLAFATAMRESKKHSLVECFAGFFKLAILRFSSATGSRWVEIRGCRAWAAAWESGFDFAVIPESPSPVCTELTCG